MGAESPMTTSIPDTQLRRTYAILIIAFVLIVAAFGWEVFALRRALLWVDHTDEVISADQELVRLTIDMETGLRGYLPRGACINWIPFRCPESVGL